MLTIGIPTFNRVNVLQMMAKSLYSAGIETPHKIRVYDDASTEFDLGFLKKLFPNAETIIRHDINIGPDENTFLMYKDFIKSGDEYFFNADSDLIFSKGCLDKAISHIIDTDGILNLFNTMRHPTIRKDEVLSEKASLGCAGTLFTRERLAEFIDYKKNEESSRNLDWQWSKYYIDKGYRLFAMTNSLVQHIGFDGYNSNISNMAYGVGFCVDSLDNGQIINDVILDVIENSKKNSIRKWYALFPFSEIPRESKIVIYGAGIVGQDYIRQIEITRHCECVGIVDRNYSQYSNVKKPEELVNIKFDYILLSALVDQTIDSMMKDIKRVSKTLLQKVIVPDRKNVIRL